MKDATIVWICTLGVAIQFGLISHTVTAEPVLARIAKVEGRVTCREPGSSAARTLRKGDITPEGSTIYVRSNALVSPIPGSVVFLGENSELVFEKLDVTKAGQRVRTREATLKLKRGSLSFALDRLNPKATRFKVETALGSLRAKGTSGSVAMLANSLQVTVSSGVVTFRTASNTDFDLTPGSLLNASQARGGTAATIVNLISRTLTTINGDGTSRQAPATAQSLSEARATFQAAVAITLGSVDAALANGLVSKDASDQIAGVLKQVNASLVSDGLTALSVAMGGNSQSTGGTFGTGGSGSIILSILGQGGGSAVVNPANTSGRVVSPER